MGEGIRGRSPVTVGRDAEVAVTERLVDEARAGHGNCLIVLGEAGAGKSRLLADIAGSATSRQAVVLSADVPTTISPPAFGMLAGALRSWLRGHAPEAEAFERFAPGLRRVLPEWPTAGAEPDLALEQLRLLTLEGALRLVELAARQSAVVLLLDDLESADPESLEFVHHASAAIRNKPVLLVGAVRTGRGGAAEAEARALSQRGRATLLTLGPLNADGVSAMISAILNAPAPAEFCDEVMARTGGIPLLVEELVGAHMARGSIRRQGTALVWSPPRGRVVPTTILERVRQKVRGLPPDCRRAVEAAAVLGRGDADLIREMTDLDGARLAEALHRAVDEGLLESLPGGLPFRHAVVAEAVVAALLPSERTELHRRAAAAIRSLHSGEALWLEDRSRHHAALGDPGEAARLLVDAARRDLAAQSPASAEARLRQSLDLAPTGDVAAAARDALADALTALGRWEHALRLDEEELAGGRVTPRRLLRMARSSLRTGRLDAAGALLERAAAVGAQTTRVDALSGLVALWRGDLERARERASAVLQAAEPKDAEVLCDALDVFGRASDMLGRRPEAVAAFERWIETAERAGLTASRLQALMEFGNVEFMSTYASDRLREARRMAEQAGAYTTLVLADLSLVWCLGATADLAEAVALGQEAVELARRFELDILPHALEALGWVLGRRAHGSGDALIDEAVRLAPGDADILVQAHDARGDVALRAGAFTEALQHFDAALDVIRSNPAVVPMATPSMRVCALIACGREHEASAALHEARALCPNPRLLIVPIWLDAAAALVAGAPAALELAVPPQTTPRYERATILVVAAQAFDGSQAVAWLREALTLYDDAGAGDDAARVRRLMRERGAPVPRARRQAAAPEESLRSRGVTRREAEVLELVRRGRSNAEIARGLFLSVRTVESHVSSLLAKLGVHSRPALIALAASLDAVSNGAQ